VSLRRFKFLSRIAKLQKNNASNRTSLDIIRDMLNVASISVKKTRIMYQANLSYFQISKYLHKLLEHGLLKFDGDSSYLITKKGLEFLDMYDAYVARCKAIEEEMDQSAKERMLLERMCSSSGSSEAQKATRKSLP
jgi:predicted transcriptional regulator